MDKVDILKACRQTTSKYHQLGPSGCSHNPSHLGVIGNDCGSLYSVVCQKRQMSAYRSVPSSFLPRSHEHDDLVLSAVGGQKYWNMPEMRHPERLFLPMAQLRRAH